MIKLQSDYQLRCFKVLKSGDKIFSFKKA